MTDQKGKIRKRLESGEIIEQKCWQFIRELNDFSTEQLDRVALTDGKREYTYRQLFDKWDEFARVFSALGICGKEHSRAAVLGTPCSESIFAFFGLNMTGASVSIISPEFSDLEKVTAKEHLTDLILNDYEVDEYQLKKILKEKDDLGLRNIILLHVPVCGDFAFAWEEFGSRLNHRRLRAVKGAVFMEELLRKYRDHGIFHEDRVCDDAVILHTSGTTKGIPKPVPLADRALNECVRRHIVSGKTRPSKERYSSILFLDMSAGFSFAGMMGAFGNGGRLIVLPTVGMGYRSFLAILHYRLTNIAFSPVMLETLTSLPFRFDLSSAESVLVAGSFVSSEDKKRYNDYLKRCGSGAKLLTGYGLVEAGIGCTLTDPESESESVGYLLPGVKAKLWDEDKECFHEIDGKVHTGVLYLSTPSLSCGRLDDEVLFELDEIDGEKYLNTHDLFTVAEDGELSYIGRANKFFVNNEGVRFDAGLVERAVSAQKDIGSCGLAPEYDKFLHDTVPVLYVTLNGTSRGGRRILKAALEQAYIQEGLIEKTALPVKCVITDDIPRTMTGKVNVHRITEENVRGDTYKTEGVYEAGKLKRIDLTYADDGYCGMGCDMFPCAAGSEGESGSMPAGLPDDIVKRFESGEITGQKIWEFIKELNSYSDERLEAIALSDSSRDYTYRQMFNMWDRYARVFSALGISGENRSRAAMVGTCAVEPITALYALNMTGTSVSMIAFNDFNDIDNWRKTIPVEKVTDVILTDIDSAPAFIRELAAEKEKLGIRNIIMLNIAMAAGDDFSVAEVRAHRRKQRDIRKIDGILFMNDLLKEYASHPVSFSSAESSDTAVIIHTSGTVSGIHKPVPHSDEGFNEAAARIVRDERFKSMMGRAVTCSGMDMSNSYAVIDQIHLMLAFGGRLHVLPGMKPGIEQLMSLIRNRANIAFFAGIIFEFLMKLPFSIDLSAFEFIIVGGSYISAGAKKRYDRFLAENGAKTRMMIGYGLSEAGAACILAPKDRKDDAIGYPLSGVKVKLYDENDGKYYDPEDGPRTGVLHIASKSVSNGRIGDTVFFEPEDIDGEKYLNTYDLVRVGKDGAMYYAGRMNKFFVNNEGVRFDAGLVENAVLSEPGIEACGLAPEYNKLLHDTIPVLYVQMSTDKRDPVKALREALINVFVKDNRIKDTNMPSMCVITDSIPLNEMGKVDTYRISTKGVKGKRFSVLPVKKDGAVISVALTPAAEGEGPDALFGVPEELEDSVFKMMAAFKE